MVVISLTAFNQSVTPSTATVSDPPADAVAEFQISLEDFAALFKVQGVANINDDADSSNSIRYFVNSTGISGASVSDTWPFKRFNAAFSKVTANAATTIDRVGSSLDETELGVVSDYMRKLSLDMLGSAQLAYLFTNDFTVQTDVVTKLKGTMTAINANLLSLHQHSITGTRYSRVAGGTTYPMLEDGDGEFYTTNDHKENTNICRELFVNLFKQAPARFANITYDKYTLPFEAGDRLTFKVTLKNTLQYGVATAPSGSDIPTVGWAASGKIPDRAYTIVLILTPAAELTNPCAEHLITLFTAAVTGIVPLP